MTSPTPRHDLYRHIHKGLRAAMFDAVQRVVSAISSGPIVARRRAWMSSSSASS